MRKSPFQSSFDVLISELGEHANFAREKVDESIANARRDKKTNLRSFTTEQFFEAFWLVDEAAQFSDLFYNQAVAFIGDEGDYDSIWQHAYHLYGLLLWERVMASKEEWTFSDNYDAKNDCFYETMNKRYTERSGD